MDDERWMGEALAEATKALRKREVPIGAVVVKDEGVIARGYNRVEARGRATAHAEMLAIREACARLGSERLTGCDIHVTLEPCPMCATAISFARLRRVYFAAADEKGGGVEHGPRIFAQATCHHRPDVYGGIGERRAAEMLRDFFAVRRN